MYTSSVIFPWCNFAWNNATRKLPGIATENFDDTVVGPTVIQWFIHGTHTELFSVFYFSSRCPVLVCLHGYRFWRADQAQPTTGVFRHGGMGNDPSSPPPLCPFPAKKRTLKSSWGLSVVANARYAFWGKNSFWLWHFAKHSAIYWRPHM